MPDVAHVTHTTTHHEASSLDHTSSETQSQLAHASRLRAPRGDGPIPCGHPGCPKMFWQMCSRNRHFESHGVVYACNQPSCKAGPWAQKASLDRHIAEHEGRRTIPCRHPICKEMFFQPYARYVHECQEHPTFMGAHEHRNAERRRRSNSIGSQPHFSDEAPQAVYPSAFYSLDTSTTSTGRTTIYGYPCIPITKDDYEAALVLTDMPQAGR